MPERPSIRLTFLGGAGSIGASSALVQVAGTSLLVDCGVRFRAGQALPDLDFLTGKKLDAIVVTHAHSDHTGALPVVHEAFPAAPIYMTPPTQDLVSILQRDALKIMSMASEREDDLPLYSERQVSSMIGLLRPVDHHRSVTVGEVVVTWLPACHILGASMVHLRTPGGNVMFTGDYSVSAQKSVPLLARPTLPVDLLVSEATYGNRLHADRRLSESRLVQTVAGVVEGGGRVLIPAFAIGRAQEVLLILKEALRKKKMPEVPVFVDGMVRSVCGVYAQHESYLTPSLAREIRTSGHPFFNKQIQPVRDPRDRRSVLDAGACVIVASSGMLHGGPSAFYASELAPREKDAILITGYQDEESPGAALLKLAAQEGPRQLRLGGRLVDVRCLFQPYSLSAHADRTQMMGLIEALRPATVVLVHGDREAKEGLAASLGVADIELAEDGDQVVRAYPPRSSSPRPLASLFQSKVAASLVGPSAGSPLRASSLAEAWFGREVDRGTMARFVDALLHAGVARQDEEDKALLWSLVPASPSASPAVRDADAEADAEALKAENPKGKLWELCARRRLPFPEEVHTSEGELHVIELRLTTSEGPVSSGAFRAFTKRLAEQRASKRLLELLESRSEAAPAPPEASSSTGKDPRMQLNEMRQLGLIQGFGYELVQQRGPPHQPIFVLRGWLENAPGERIHTEPVEARSKKEGEAAASALLLALAIEASASS